MTKVMIYGSLIILINIIIYNEIKIISPMILAVIASYKIKYKRRRETRLGIAMGATLGFIPILLKLTGENPIAVAIGLPVIFITGDLT
ncbi:hypothetical protein EOM82_08915, partial [bacterium]|nr:hypothetical protein [bacterium]